MGAVVIADHAAQELAYADVDGVEFELKFAVCMVPGCRHGGGAGAPAIGGEAAREGEVDLLRPEREGEGVELECDGGRLLTGAEVVVADGEAGEFELLRELFVPFTLGPESGCGALLGGLRRGRCGGSGGRRSIRIDAEERAERAESLLVAGDLQVEAVDAGGGHVELLEIAGDFGEDEEAAVEADERFGTRSANLHSLGDEGGWPDATDALEGGGDAAEPVGGDDDGRVAAGEDAWPGLFDAARDAEVVGLGEFDLCGERGEGGEADAEADLGLCLEGLGRSGKPA